MAEGSDKSVVDHLQRLDTMFARMVNDFDELKRRVTTMEPGGSQQEILLANLASRLEDVNERLNRIERRLDILMAELPDAVAGKGA
jgi:uncharacterized coiled-coil protein SlyX